MAKRQAYDIIAEILVIARNPVRKTHIVYRANLNFDVVNKHIASAMDDGFLKFEAPFYETTDLGEEYVSRYTYMRSLA